MIPAEISAKIQEYKAKQLAGTITIDELRDAVSLMRGTRSAASAISASSTSRKRLADKAPVDANALLDQLEGL